MQDRYQVRFGGERSQSKDALQLLQRYYDRSSAHEADDRRVRQEVHNNPQSAHRFDGGKSRLVSLVINELKKEETCVQSCTYLRNPKTD